MTKYEELNSKNRDEYLQSLSEEFNIDREIVDAVADLLGPSEDFDGLINLLEDYE